MDGRLFFAVGMGLLSLVGLVMASQAVDDAIYTVGLLFFGFGIIFIFVVIHRTVGHPQNPPDQGAAGASAVESQPGPVAPVSTDKTSSEPSTAG
jgi:hypothetical protein